ncbi:hypothetical protein MMC10_005780 [Thelotrema lepadinum]|nr:hypothetical protein [Thelotrema lepadinum]
MDSYTCDSTERLRRKNAICRYFALKNPSHLLFDNFFYAFQFSSDNTLATLAGSIEAQAAAIFPSSRQRALGSKKNCDAYIASRAQLAQDTTDLVRNARYSAGKDNPPPSSFIHLLPFLFAELTALTSSSAEISDRMFSLIVEHPIRYPEMESRPRLKYYPGITLGDAYAFALISYVRSVAGFKMRDWYGNPEGSSTVFKGAVREIYISLDPKVPSPAAEVE